MTPDVLNQVGNIDANSEQSAAPQAQALAQRVDTLNQAGHTWMPADMATTLAASPTSDATMLVHAAAIKTHLAQVWDGVSEGFDDQILHAQPSLSMSLSRMMRSTLGPVPVAEGDLTQIQSGLQSEGFGKGLPANGVWGADWNDAYNQWKNILVQNQLAGDEPGAVSVKKASGWFGKLLSPANDLNAIVGYAKSLPGDVRDLAANLVGSAVNTVTGNETASDEGINSPGAAAAITVQKLLGNSEARSHVASQIQHPDAALAQDVGTVLFFAPIAGQGGKIAEVLQGSLGKGISAEAAERGPGYVAKSFFGGLTKTDIESSASPLITEQGARGAFAQATARMGLRESGLPGSQFARSVPLLRSVAPYVGRLADADGLYYQGRSFLALPYILPSVRIAGDLGQRAVITGAAIQAGARVSQAVAGPNNLTNDVLNDGFTSDIDRNLDRILGTPGEHPFTRTVNALGYLLHGELGSTANSTAVGNAVERLQSTVARIERDQNLGVIWEKAMATTGNPQRFEDLEKLAGSNLGASNMIWSNVYKLAAQQGALLTTRMKDGLVYGDAGYDEALAANHNDIWADIHQREEAVRKFLAVPDNVQTQLARQAQDLGINRGLKEYTGNLRNWTEQGMDLRDMASRGTLAEFFGGRGQAAIRDAQEALDGGLPSGSTARTIAGSRSDYVHATQRAFNRVDRGVNKARVHLNQAITDAQDQIVEGGTAEDNIEATNKVKSAKLRQRQFESALTDNDMGKAVRILKSMRSTRASDPEWDRLLADHTQLRHLIRPTLDPGQTYDLNDTLDAGVNPDELYTKVNGPPNLDARINSTQWIIDNLDQPDGSIGYMRSDGKTIQDAKRELPQLLQVAEQAGADGDEAQYQAAMAAMRDWAYTHMNIERRGLGLWQSAQDLHDKVLAIASKRLASDAFLQPDASEEAKAFVARSAERGYKPVFGSHIEHIWSGDITLPELHGETHYISQTFKNLGVSVKPVTTETRADRLNTLRSRNVQRALDDPRATAPVGGDGRTVMGMLADKDLLPRELPFLSRQAFYVAKTAGLHRNQIAKVAADTGLNVKEAGALYEQEVAQAIGLDNLPRRQIIKALTTPGDGTNGAGQPWHWPGVNQVTANLIFNGLRDAHAELPASIVGWQSIENHFRGGFWLLGKLANARPETGEIQAIANAPNQLILLRNELRFSLSPFFDIRRVVKTNYKMGLEHVASTWDPLQKMSRGGYYDAAHRYLESLVGKASVAGYDETDMYAHSQSILGKFNARQFEAYYAWQMKKSGATDDEVRNGLRRVFEYGSTRTAGRTPLESSLNTVFFPFSFLKNLYRNTGMYYLDHIQQAMLLTAGINAYERANTNNEVTNWVDDHFPILTEISKLNAFSHGLSAGQPGGINAPLLNLFLPQAWGQHYSVSNLNEAIPVWKDFSQVWQNSVEQAHIGYNAEQNAVSYAYHLGRPRSPYDPYLPTITPQAQYEKASVMRNNFISALSSTLDHNEHAAPGNKILWPQEIDGTLLPGQVRGQPVDRTTIGWLVHQWYPAYSPQFSVDYAESQNTKATDAIADLAQSNPTQAAQWGALVKLTASYSDRLNKNEYDTATARTISTQFRNIVVKDAETEPGFLAFYNSHMAWVWGPIEGVGGG